MCAARCWGLVERAHHISLIELSRGSLAAMGKGRALGLWVEPERPPGARQEWRKAPATKSFSRF